MTSQRLSCMMEDPSGHSRPISRRHAGRRPRLAGLVPSSALGRAGAVAPSNRVVMGCIGLGIQGMGNLRTFRGNPEVQVVAVCDVHETQRLRAKQAVDEFYGNKDCAAYKDFRELIARKDIDAVQITAPDHWHSLMVLEASRQASTCTARSRLAGASRPAGRP